MLDSFINWVIPVSQNLASAALLGLAALLIKRWNESSAEARQKRIDLASRTAARTFSKAMDMAVVLAVLWYLVTQLRPLITDPSAPSRTDVFLIVFWTFWLLIVFVRVIAGPFATARMHAPEDAKRNTPPSSTPQMQETPPTDPSALDNSRPSTHGSGSA